MTGITVLVCFAVVYLLFQNREGDFARARLQAEIRLLSAKIDTMAKTQLPVPVIEGKIICAEFDRGQWDPNRSRCVLPSIDESRVTRLESSFALLETRMPAVASTNAPTPDRPAPLPADRKSIGKGVETLAVGGVRGCWGTEGQAYCKAIEKGQKVLACHKGELFFYRKGFSESGKPATWGRCLED